MFITTIHSIDSLEKLKRAKADAVIIGVEHYSIRSSITVKKEDLQLWKKKCKKLGLNGSLTLAHSQNSQMSFMYGFFFVKFLFFTVVCVVIVV